MHNWSILWSLIYSVGWLNYRFLFFLLLHYKWFWSSKFAFYICCFCEENSEFVGLRYSIIVLWDNGFRASIWVWCMTWIFMSPPPYIHFNQYSIHILQWIWDLDGRRSRTGFFPVKILWLYHLHTSYIYINERENLLSKLLSTPEILYNICTGNIPKKSVLYEPILLAISSSYQVYLWYLILCNRSILRAIEHTFSIQLPESRDDDIYFITIRLERGQSARSWFLPYIKPGRKPIWSNGRWFVLVSFSLLYH